MSNQSELVESVQHEFRQKVISDAELGNDFGEDKIAYPMELQSVQ